MGELQDFSRHRHGVPTSFFVDCRPEKLPFDAWDPRVKKCLDMRKKFENKYVSDMPPQASPCTRGSTYIHDTETQEWWEYCSKTRIVTKLLQTGRGLVKVLECAPMQHKRHQYFWDNDGVGYPF